MQETVQIAEYESVMEAEWARSVLEEAGIKAMIEADDAGGMLPSLAYAGGGVPLFVLEDDEPRARELLTEREQERKEREEEE